MTAAFFLFVATILFTKNVQHMEEVALKYRQADESLNLKKLQEQEDATPDQNFLLLGPRVKEDPIGSRQMDKRAQNRATGQK